MKLQLTQIKWVLVCVGIILLISMFLQPAPLPDEAFSSQESCPTSAVRDGDGRIRVEPGSKVFSTMKDYTTYLAGVYSDPKNSTCIPPVVSTGRKGPVTGVLGGLGTGTIGAKGVGKEGPDRTVLNTVLNTALNTALEGQEQTSATTPVNKLDDYEYSRVFQLEHQPRNEPLQKETKNKLIGQNILDWASLPFNSEERADAEKEFIAGRMEDGFREPKTGVFFKNMDGTNVLPPDEEALKMREKAILAAYKPTSLSKHVLDTDTERVGDLVSKMYSSDPNWEPVVEKVGPNQYQVVELKPKPRKEKWEDQQTVNSALAESEDIEQSINPVANIKIYDRQTNDPYFDKRGVQDKDNNAFWDYKDFNKWTPGLERMFAPTADNKEWF